MAGKAKAHRLRIGRHGEANQIYLVTTVTWRRVPYFSDLYHGRLLVKQLYQQQAITLCHVVMPDHLHWLMQLAEGADLSAVVQKLKSCTTRELRRAGIEQVVWQKGFHDHALRSEEDIKAFARYIVANPIRAGLVNSVKQYSLWDAIWL